MSRGALTLWSRLLLGTFARAGVREVVVSPGSRSTPFTHAALTTPGLTCHSLYDERSAAFFALGQARITGRPTLLLCTSGSAAAQYFPAVVEASASFTPLLVLTADRPFELQDCGAPQTMDQTKLYGASVRRHVELGNPDESVGALDALERLAAQAVAATNSPVPGPVHVNARARKPLEPVQPSTPEEHAAWGAISERLQRPGISFFDALAAPSTQGIAELAAACRATPRGLLVCGPIGTTRAADAHTLHELSAATGYPLCAEATSQARFSELPQGVEPALGALDAMFRSELAERFAPEIVLQFGAPPTSSAFASWLGSRTVARAVITPHGLLDPQSRARWLLSADPFVAARALTDALRASGPALAEPSERARFTASWRRADTSYFGLVDSLLSASGEDVLEEANAVRVSLDQLPPGALLGVGNSLPVRDVDAFVRPQPKDIAVWSQRGLNGIDGLVSGALGAAIAHGAPSLLLLGDVSFLHDVGGLAAARLVRSPAVIVVIDNGGGRIFDDLPVARTLAAQRELAPFWLTPPEANLEHAAALYGVPYARATTPRALAAAVADALVRPGVTLIHAVVVPESARLAGHTLRNQFDRALQAEYAR